MGTRRREPLECRSWHRGTPLPVPQKQFRGLTRERPGAEGSERIAPPEQAPQGDSAIPQGSIEAGRKATAVRVA